MDGYCFSDQKLETQSKDYDHLCSASTAGHKLSTAAIIVNFGLWKKAWIDVKSPRFFLLMVIPDIVVIESGMKLVIAPSAPRAHCYIKCA